MCCDPASTSPENAPGNARSLLEALWETAGLFFQTDPPDGSRLRPNAEGVPKGKPKEMPKSHACRTPGVSEDAMTELRRIKMKIGDAAFEADVPEHKGQPMYDQFLAMLDRRNRTSRRPSGGFGQVLASQVLANKVIASNGVAGKPDIEERTIASCEMFSPDEMSDQNLLLRI